MYKATLGLAVLTREGKGGPPFCLISFINGSTLRIDSKNRLTCLVFRHSIIFSTPYSFLLLDFRLDAKYYEADRNLRGKLLRRKPHTTAQAQMSVISGHGIINIFKILIDFGWSFSDEGALPGGPF